MFLPKIPKPLTWGESVRGSMRFGAAFSRVVHAVVPIPAVSAVSVLHSAAVGGFDAGVVGPF